MTGDILPRDDGAFQDLATFLGASLESTAAYSQEAKFD